MKFEFASKRISLILLSLIILILVCSVECDNGVASLSYYPSNYSILKGTYSSGSIPISVQTVDADYLVIQSEATEKTASMYPLEYMLKGSTNLISGDISNLASNDSAYMVFRSYEDTTCSLQYYNSSDGESLTTSGAYSDKVILTFTPSLTGDYLITASAELSGSSVTYDVRVRMIIDGTTYSSSMWQPDEANMWESFFTSKVINLGSGSHTIRIQYSSENFAQTVTIRRARIMALKLLDFESNEAETEQTVTSGIYVDIVTRTFTPSTAGVYLILATAEVEAASTSNSIYTRLQIDGVAKDEMITEGETTTDYEVFAAHNVTILSAASHTIKIQARGGGFGTMYIRRARITAVRLSDYYDYQTGGSEGVSSTSSTNWVDKAVLTFTPSTEDSYLIMATVKISLNAATNGYQPAVNFTIDGAEYGYSQFGLSATTDYLTFAAMVNASLSATSHTLKIAYRTTDSLYTAYIRDAEIVAVRLARQYVSEVEFIGVSNTYNWTRLSWVLDCAWTMGSVNVSLQLYDFTRDDYPTSGNGCITCISGGVPSDEESESQTIIANPVDFRNATGHWKMKIKGTRITNTQFDLKIDLIEFRPCYNEYEVLTEFTFSGITNATVVGLNFTVVSEYSIASVRIVIQVWNYSSSAYITNGEAYLEYVSAGINESKTLSLNISRQFCVSDGNAKIKISGVQIESEFQQKINQIMLLHSYVASDNLDEQPFDWTWVFLCALLIIIGLFLLLIFVFKRSRKKTETAIEKKIDPFSTSFGIPHKWMIGKKVLLEIDPTANYQNALFDFAYEAKNNGEKLFIFTSANSPLHSKFAGTKSAKFFLLASEAYSSQEINNAETLLPVNDLSVLLNEFVRIQKFRTKKTKTVLFDNVSDIILLCGFEKTYKFIRWLLETPSSPRTTTLFVFNPAAHDPRKSSSIRGLFQNRLAYTKSGPKVGTL